MEQREPLRRLGAKAIFLTGVSMTNGTPEHLTTTEARAGTTPHVTRVVLGVGLLLVITIFALILFIAR
jgi:hypothetical protein